MNNKLSIITIGSAKNKGIFDTLNSVLINNEEIYKWIFVVFNLEEKKTLLEYILKKKGINFYYEILVNNQGITLALNLALKRLIKEKTYIWILNAGDLAISKVSSEINTKLKYDLYFFPVNLKSFKSSKYKKCFTSQNWKQKIKYSPCVLHQGVLANAELFRKYGFFNSDFTSIMDYEWFYRLSFKKNIRSYFGEKTIAEFILGGKSSNIFISCKEHFFLYKKYEKSNFRLVKKVVFLFIKKSAYIILNYYLHVFFETVYKNLIRGLFTKFEKEI